MSVWVSPDWTECNVTRHMLTQKTSRYYPNIEVSIHTHEVHTNCRSILLETLNLLAKNWRNPIWLPDGMFGHLHPPATVLISCQWWTCAMMFHHSSMWTLSMSNLCAPAWETFHSCPTISLWKSLLLFCTIPNKTEFADFSLFASYLTEPRVNCLVLPS